MADCNQYPCPEDCSSALPEVQFNDCAPETAEGEVEWMPIAKPDFAGFQNVEDPAEWDTHLANGEIRLLRVIGDIPEPEETTKVLSGRRNVVTGRTRTLNLDVDETNDRNYEFVRSTSCNGSYKMWYVDVSGKVYGGNCGIVGTLKLNPVHTRGKGENLLFKGSFKWDALSTPVRNIWPL